MEKLSIRVRTPLWFFRILAFDSVSHPILILTLHRFGIVGKFSFTWNRSPFIHSNRSPQTEGAKVLKSFQALWSNKASVWRLRLREHIASCVRAQNGLHMRSGRHKSLADLSLPTRDISQLQQSSRHLQLLLNFSWQIPTKIQYLAHSYRYT